MRKRRKSPRALRFADVKVGDILIQANKTMNVRRRPLGPAKPANDVEQEYDIVHYESFVIVTDLWFDPVYGQNDETAGQMVGVQYYRCRSGIGSKMPYTLRGLASNRYRYATLEEIAVKDAADEAKRRRDEAVARGEIAHLPRQRRTPFDI